MPAAPAAATKVVARNNDLFIRVLQIGLNCYRASSRVTHRLGSLLQGAGRGSRRGLLGRQHIEITLHCLVLSGMRTGGASRKPPISGGTHMILGEGRDPKGPRAEPQQPASRA